MSEPRAPIDGRRLKKLRQDAQVLATAMPKSMPILEKRLAREELPWLLDEVARLDAALERQMEQASVAERASNAWEENALVYAQNAAAAERERDEALQAATAEAALHDLTRAERDAALALLEGPVSPYAYWIGCRVCLGACVRRSDGGPVPDKPGYGHTEWCPVPAVLTAPQEAGKGTTRLRDGGSDVSEQPDDLPYGASAGYISTGKPARPNLEEQLRALGIGAFSGPGTTMWRQTVEYALSLERERDAARARVEEIATMATQWIDTPHAGRLFREIEQRARAGLPGFETEARDERKES